MLNFIIGFVIGVAIGAAGVAFINRTVTPKPDISGGVTTAAEMREYVRVHGSIVPYSTEYAKSIGYDD